jgi:hypothetical protein
MPLNKLFRAHDSYAGIFGQLSYVGWTSRFNVMVPAQKLVHQRARAQRPKLRDDLATSLMHGGRNFLPTRKLLWRVEAGNIGEALRPVGECSALGDDPSGCRVIRRGQIILVPPSASGSRSAKSTFQAVC